MCRWLAYQGPEIYLEDLIVKPKYSLIYQSRFAQENFVKDLPGIPDGRFPTNGDGFGIAWYGQRDVPGLYRELRPAWSDRNLLNLAEQIKSGLFLAHLRAAYHGVVQRTNSHPFRYKKWVFQHNGEISGFDKIKQSLQCMLKPELFCNIKGSTDSETAFYLALHFGLESNPKEAMLKMVREVEGHKIRSGIKEPFSLTCAFSDGEYLYAIRYSTEGNPKTMYHNKSSEGLDDVIEGSHKNEGIILLSEPLNECSDNWQSIPEASFVKVKNNQIDISDFCP